MTYAPYASPGPLQPRARIGWTAPNIIYDDLRAMKVDADRLNALVAQSATLGVPDATYRSAWAAWYQNFNTFFDKTVGSTFNKAFVAPFETDELAQRVKTASGELNGFVADYNRAVATVQPTAQMSAPPARDPKVDPPAAAAAGSSNLPWWFWVGATIAVGAGGYFLYQKYLAAQHTKRVLQREVLPELIGPKLARAASHDVSLPMLHARDPMSVAPALGLSYRPMGYVPPGHDYDAYDD